MTITKRQLKTIVPLSNEETDYLRYKKYPLASLMLVATPQALVERAKLIRSSGRSVQDVESTAAHLELAAETISELVKHLVE